MNFKEYQEKAYSTAIYPNKGKNVVYPTLGLAGEAGEVAEKIKKYLRDGGELKREDVLKELGDVLWYITAVANEIGYTLEEVAVANLDKLLSRQARGTLHGSGDDR